MRAPRQPRSKAGRPIGFLVPAHMPNVALSDKEFAEIARAINLSLDEAAARPGCAAQGFDEGFRSALDFALRSYVHARSAAAALPSEREVAAALAELGRHALDAAERMQPPARLLEKAVSTAAGAAWTMIANEAMAAAEKCLAVAKAAAEEGARLDDAARQTKKREAIDTSAFVATLREILKAARIKTAIGMVSEAGAAAERYPMFRVTTTMLDCAYSRLSDGASDETRRVLDMAPATLVKFISNAKIT